MCVGAATSASGLVVSAGDLIHGCLRLRPSLDGVALAAAGSSLCAPMPRNGKEPVLTNGGGVPPPDIATQIKMAGMYHESTRLSTARSG